MAQMNFEQENDGLTGIQSFNKIQTSGFNGKSSLVSNTPIISKVFSGPVKTPLNKSSRKAFGNVSNVLSCKQTITTKVQHKTKSVAKESLKSTQEFNIGFNPNDIKSIETEVETNCNANSKFMDEIESMFPIEEELMSEVNDSITKDLFAIDEQTLFGMQFDSDMDQFMVQPKNTNLNIDDLF